VNLTKQIVGTWHPTTISKYSQIDHAFGSGYGA